MTTKVTIEANHGWPVLVTGVHPLTRETLAYGGTVPAGETRAFHCHSGMDLVIHEIQPNEAAPHSDQDGALGAALIAFDRWRVICLPSINGRA